MLNLFTVTKTIVTDTNAYSSGDFVGTAILTLTDAAPGGGCKLQTIALTDLTKQSLAIDFLFWSTVCSNTTFTNNAALDIHDTDLLAFLGGVSFVAGDYFALNDNSVGVRRDIALAMAPSNDGNIYCTPVARGTPTYDASALQAAFVFERVI